MSGKYSVVINSKDMSGKSLSKTISSINPEAQPSDLKAMAQALNALTKNTYDYSERVAREIVDTATDKTTRSVSLSVSHYDTSQAKNVITPIGDASTLTVLLPVENSNIHVRFLDEQIGDVLPSLKDITILSGEVTAAMSQQLHYTSTYTTSSLQNTWALYLHLDNAVVGSLSVTVHIPASDTYAEYNRTLTFDIVDSI